MKKLLATLAIGLSLTAFALPPTATAGDIPPGCPGGPAGPPTPGTVCPGSSEIDCPDGYTPVSVRVSGSQCVKGIFAYLNQIVRVLEGLIGVGVVVAIVVAGVQYITSVGSPDAVKAAKGRLGNALIALVVYLLLVAIVRWLGLDSAIT